MTSPAPQIALSPKGEFSMVDPLTGAYRWVPAAEAQQAVKDGYQPESLRDYQARQTKEQERVEYDRPVAAGAAGLARGLTFGLSDLAMTKIGGVAPETLAKLQEYNPMASGGGEVAGAIGGALIPGGPAARLVTGAAGLGERAALGAGRLLGKEATSLLPRLAGAVTKEAAIGGAYGAGAGVSEAAVEDLSPEQAAGRVLTDIAKGAATGAAVGGLVWGAGSVVGKVKRVASTMRDVSTAKSARDVAQAEVQGAKALGATPTAIAEKEAQLIGAQTAYETAQTTMAKGVFGATIGQAVGKNINLTTQGILHFLLPGGAVKLLGAALAPAVKGALGAAKGLAVSAAPAIERAVEVGQRVLEVGGPVVAQQLLSSVDLHAPQTVEEQVGQAVLEKLAPGAQRVKGLLASSDLYELDKHVQAMNPGDLQNAMLLHGQDLPPQMSREAAQATANAVRYLKETHPPEDATDLQMDQYRTRLRTVVAPATMVQAFSEGKLTPEHVQTWARVYPEGLAALRQLASAQAAAVKARGGLYSTEQQQQQALLLGDPAAGPRLYDPGTIARFQALHAQAKQPPLPKGRPVRGLDKALQTPWGGNG